MLSLQKNLQDLQDRSSWVPGMGSQETGVTWVHSDAHYRLSECIDERR